MTKGNNDDQSLQKLQLLIQGKQLKNVAGLLKSSDPYAVVTQIEDGSNPVVLGKTEVINQCLDPTWMKEFYLQYKMGKPTVINVSVYHSDGTEEENDSSNTTTLPNNTTKKLMGSAMFEVGDILGSRGTKAKKLKQGGMLIVRVSTAHAQSLGELIVSFQGVQLRNIERRGVSDPFYELSRQEGSELEPWLTVYRSRPVMNSLDPIWEPAKINLDRLCDANRDRPVLFSLYDFEKNGKHKKMGCFETCVNAILKGKVSGNTGNTIQTFALKDDVTNDSDNGNGKIVIADAYVQTPDGIREGSGGATSADGDENLQDADVYLHVILHGIQLQGVANPLFEFSRELDGEHRLTVYRSTHVLDNSNPRWEKGQILMSRLCDDDATKPIRLSLLDYNVKKETNIHVGDVECTVSAILAAKQQQQPDSNPNDDSSLLEITSKKGEFVGHVKVVGASLNKVTADGSHHVAAHSSEEYRATFYDYVGGGCELRLCIGINFSNSNSGCLHDLSPNNGGADDNSPGGGRGAMNDYEKAILNVGSILSKYDRKQKIPVWGFGASICGVQQNCFQLGRGKTEASGVKEVIKFYRRYLSLKVHMQGRSIASDIIENACTFARTELETSMRNGEQSYTVLLILTDGNLEDMSKIKETIRYNNDFSPLSIVIIGIGNDDFSELQSLDDHYENDDDVRDIVQFVEFNEHNSSKHSLSSAVLDEIPDQVVEFFQSHDIPPNPVSDQGVFDLEPDDYDEDDFCIEQKTSSTARRNSAAMQQWSSMFMLSDDDGSNSGNIVGYVKSQLRRVKCCTK